jgi:hypothetical protein
MGKRTWWETTRVQGGELLDKVRQLVHEGNVRRIVIKQGGKSIAEFPLTAGVVGVVFAPVLAAVGALAALAKDCSIAVEREEWVPEAGTKPGAAPAPGEKPADEEPDSEEET